MEKDVRVNRGGSSEAKYSKWERILEMPAASVNNRVVAEWREWDSHLHGGQTLQAPQCSWPLPRGTEHPLVGINFHNAPILSYL